MTTPVFSHKFSEQTLYCKELNDCLQIKQRITCVASSMILPYVYVATTIVRVALICFCSVNLAFGLTCSAATCFCVRDWNAFIIHCGKGVTDNVLGLGTDAFQFLFMELKLILGALVHPCIV